MPCFRPHANQIANAKLLLLSLTWPPTQSLSLSPIIWSLSRYWNLINKIDVRLKNKLKTNVQQPDQCDPVRVRGCRVLKCSRSDDRCENRYRRWCRGRSSGRPFLRLLPLFETAQEDSGQTKCFIFRSHQIRPLLESRIGKNPCRTRR